MTGEVRGSRSIRERHSGNSRRRPVRSSHRGTHSDANDSERAISALLVPRGRCLASLRAWWRLNAGVGRRKQVVPSHGDLPEDTAGEACLSLDEEVDCVVGEVVVIPRPLPRCQLGSAFPHDVHLVTTAGELGERDLHGRHSTGEKAGTRCLVGTGRHWSVARDNCLRLVRPLWSMTGWEMGRRTRAPQYDKRGPEGPRCRITVSPSAGHGHDRRSRS